MYIHAGSGIASIFPLPFRFWVEYSSFSTYHHSVQLQLIFFSEKLHLFAAVAGAEFRISWLGVCLPKNKLVNMNEFSSLHMPVKFMYLFASCAVSNSFAKFVSSSSRYHIFFFLIFKIRTTWQHLKWSHCASWLLAGSSTIVVVCWARTWSRPFVRSTRPFGRMAWLTIRQRSGLTRSHYVCSAPIWNPWLGRRQVVFRPMAIWSSIFHRARMSPVVGWLVDWLGCR